MIEDEKQSLKSSSFQDKSKEHSVSISKINYNFGDEESFDFEC
jgi:hypothetical protein